jgi:hypothetical protein
MFDLASAELLGEYVVREIKDILAEKLRDLEAKNNAQEARIARLEAAIEAIGRSGTAACGANRNTRRETL